MKNKKVLVLASLLTLGLITGCGKKATTSSASVANSVASSAEVVSSSEAAASSESVVASEESSESSASVDPVNHNDKKVIMSDLPDGKIEENIKEDIFEFYKNADTSATKEKKAMEITDAGENGTTYNEVKYTKVLKANSASSLTENTEARVIKFTATGKGTVKIIAKSPVEGSARKIGVYNVEKKVEHDKVSVDALGEYTLTFHYAGTYFITFGDNVSIYSIEADWQDGVSETDWVPVSKLLDPLFLNADEMVAQTYEQNVVFDNFEIKAGVGSTANVIVDSGSKTVDGHKYSQRIKLGGTGSYDVRSVHVKLTGAARVTFHCISSSSDADRNVEFVDAEGNKIGEGIATGSAPASLVFSVKAAGEYAFYSLSGGVNIYGVTIEY